MAPPVNEVPTPIKVHVAAAADDAAVLPIASALIHHLEGRVPHPPDPRIYGAWSARVSQRSIILAALGDADVVLCAHDPVTQSKAARQAASLAAGSRKPLFFHTDSDDVRPSAPVDGLLWRSSAFRSRLRPHERIATGCVPDLLDERTSEDPVFLQWQPTPAVGFIGHVAAGLRSLGYLRRGWQHFHGFTLRERVLRALERGSLVKTEFLRRSRNLGPPMAGVDRDASIRAMRREYVRSVYASHYSLCVRGAGNWSYRLFETLSAGRIPLLIDTDCALPLEGEIDWERHLCRIPVASLNSAANLLMAFHERLGPQGLLEMQRRNRQLWLDRLEPGAFFEQALRQTAGRAG